MALTHAELKDQLEKGKTKGLLQKCACCGIPLQETITGNRKTTKGYVCSDCYFEQLGEVVEKHPISMHHSLRGA